MAATTSTPIQWWNNLHENGPWKSHLFHRTALAGKADIPLAVERYNDAATEIQRLLAAALNIREGFRAIGSRWSLSSIAHHSDQMQDNQMMNIKMALSSQDLQVNSDYQPENLYLLQCGNVIKEIHNFLNSFGKSLRTTGASNGQTIAGCISTGVHGSAFDVGAVQDCVVGLNLIVGPHPQDRVYLERASRPALSDAFAEKLKCRVIRDDELFNAALVSLGAFGFIHGVVIEAEDRFLLKRYVKRVNKADALKLATTLNFADSAIKIASETDSKGKGLRPYHYKVFINPYVDDPQYVVELMYKKPYQDGYPDPIPGIRNSLYKDLIHLFIRIAEKWKNSIPKLISILNTSILPAVDQELTGKIGEMFYDAGYEGPAFACSVGVNHKDCARALEILVNLARKEGPIPGIYAMRFVKQSRATLAFTKYPITCMLEIDGINWDAKAHQMISLERFCTRMIEVLQENGIPFTLHWGKNADWGFTGLAEHMFGDKVKVWKAQRKKLLRPETEKLFSNGFLQVVGLT
jgi:hypothetical protein